MAMLKVTQVRSADRHRSRSSAAPCARSGCARIGHTVEHADRPEIRGMLAKVPHLVDDGRGEV